MAVYSFCLVLSAFHIVRLIGLWATLLTIGAFLVRINLPKDLSNKYVVWTVFLLVALNGDQWDEFLVFFLGDGRNFALFALCSYTLELIYWLSSSFAEMPIIRGFGLAMVLHVVFRGERAFSIFHEGLKLCFL